MLTYKIYFELPFFGGVTETTYTVEAESEEQAKQMAIAAKRYEINNVPYKIIDVKVIPR